MVNESVTIPADVDPSGFHLLFGEVLFEPSIRMAGTRNQMVKE
jgi:hypothetical protein